MLLVLYVFAVIAALLLGSIQFTNNNNKKDKHQ